jgi:hypothetical protein
MTLIKGTRGGLSSLGPNTTIYGEESLIENGEIEELHYLSVKVERMKKAMLGKVEGAAANLSRDKAASVLDQNKSEHLVNDHERREEMLYSSMDNLLETQTGGGDIGLVMSADGKAISRGRDSGLNTYSEIAINDQTGGRSGRVTNLDI